MSSTLELLTKEEIALLTDYDLNIDPDITANKYGMTRGDYDKKIDTALSKREKLREELNSVEIPRHVKPVNGRIGEEQTGTMKVSSQIIKYLSEGIYSSPANSIKELINNAYDADATEVIIECNQDRVEIDDNGKGMSWKEFDEEFTFIGSSFKRFRSEFTEIYNRKKIGFLGIGFISVWELCDTLTITSAKKGENTYFVAKIDFSKYREDYSQEKEFYEISEYSIINHLKTGSEYEQRDGFTIIELTNLLPGFKEVIDDRSPFDNNEPTPLQLFSYLTEKQVGLTDIGRYWQLIMELSLIAPIPYEGNGPIKKVNSSIINDIKSDLSSLNFSVKWNKKIIKKCFVFPSIDVKYDFIEINEEIGPDDNKLKFKGYFYAQHGIIKPKEFNGILIRVKNVAIGGIDRSLLNYSSSSNQIFRNWIFGELYVTNGLEDAMNINRNQFKTTNSNYMLFKEKIHEILDKKVFKLTYEDFYLGTKKTRAVEREREHKDNLIKLVSNNLGASFTINRDIDDSKETDDADDIVVIDTNKKQIEINPNAKILNNFQKKDRPLVEKVLLILEISYNKSRGDVSKMKELFIEQIRKMSDS